MTCLTHRKQHNSTTPSDENDFAQPREQWEDAVFANAAYFSVTLFRGRGQHQRWEFHDLEAAMACALQTEGNNGRGRLLYAVTASGRQLCLDRANWPKYLELWPRSRLGRERSQ